MEGIKARSHRFIHISPNEPKVVRLPRTGEMVGEELCTQIVMLGTGTPAPNPERSGPGVAIVVDDRAYIVDCRPTIVRCMTSAFLKHNIKALRPVRPRHLLITHLHSENTLGCPDLLITPWSIGRNKDKNFIDLQGFGNLGGLWKELKQ